VTARANPPASNRIIEVGSLRHRTPRSKGESESYESLELDRLWKCFFLRMLSEEDMMLGGVDIAPDLAVMLNQGYFKNSRKSFELALSSIIPAVDGANSADRFSESFTSCFIGACILKRQAS